MLTKFEQIAKLIDCVIRIQTHKQHMNRNITELAKIYVTFAISETTGTKNSTVLKCSRDDMFLVACHPHYDRLNDDSTLTIVENNSGENLFTVQNVISTRSIEYFAKEKKGNILDNWNEEVIFQRSLVVDDITLLSEFIEFHYHNVLSEEFYLSINATRLLQLSTEEIQNMIDIFEEEYKCI